MLGEEDANALMTEFPSVEADELVTKQFLRAELAEFRSEFLGDTADMRGEVGALRTELRGELAELGTELRGEIAELGTELRGEIAELRTEMRSEFGTVRGEIADLRNDLTLRMVALFGTAVVVLGTLNAIS